MAKTNIYGKNLKFFGLTKYYRYFLKDFPKIIALLTRLTRKHVMYEWSNSYEENFQKLKAYVTSTLVLTLLIGSAGFEVYYN